MELVVCIQVSCSVSKCSMKESYILRGATAYLKRLHADRRSKSLGLTEFVPYDERGCEPDEQMQVGFLAFDRTVGLFI